MSASSAKGQRVFVTNADATGGSGLTDTELRATPVPVTVSAPVDLDAGDIQIGAVELKDSGTDTRANVLAANTARTTGTVVVATQAIDAAGAVLSTSALATSSKQDTQITAEQAILAKIIAAPATEAKQDTLIAKDFATQTTLASVLAKIIAAPATEAKQPTIGTSSVPSTDVITTQRPSVTQVISTALEASKVLKASAGQLVQLSVFNSKASSQFILLINSTSLPGNGAVTLLYPPIPIPAASLLVLDLPAPLVASNGIVAANSSTGTFSLTIGSADCAFYAQIN